MKTDNKKLEQRIKKLEQKIKRMEEITVVKSLTKNIGSWIAIFIAIYCIAPDNYGKGIITFFILYFFSYYIHLETHKNTHLFTRPHHYHHENDNFFSHFIQYVLELGMPSIFLIIYSLCGTIFLDKWVILFVSVLYTTVHNINYSFFKVNHVHKLHHEHVLTNIGPDFCDVMFGTKHPEDDIENTNHYIPNVIIITLCILWLKYKCLSEPFQTIFFKYANCCLMGCFVFYMLASIHLHFL
jgi:hypothetical protein